MKTWDVELVTNDVYVNTIEIEADTVEKIDYYTLLVDGVLWQVPKKLGMSFARVEEKEI